MGATEGVWTLSAYVLTFASFMLPVSTFSFHDCQRPGPLFLLPLPLTFPSPRRRQLTLPLAQFGKIADIYSAKVMLVLGITWVGAFSIGIALAQDKVVLFVLRALAGLGYVSPHIPLHILLHYADPLPCLSA